VPKLYLQLLLYRVLRQVDLRVFQCILGVFGDGLKASHQFIVPLLSNLLENGSEVEVHLIQPRDCVLLPHHLLLQYFIFGMKHYGVGGYPILLYVFFLLLPFELHLLSLLSYNLFESFTILVILVLCLFQFEVLLDVKLCYIEDKIYQKLREAEFVAPVNLVFEI
jgi:hypothetical protein